MEKCIIAAVGSLGELGVGGQLPWHISEDLKYFKRVTIGCPVIMGSRTWESLPFKPLKGRLNIVLSRRDNPYPEALCVKSVEEAFAAAEMEECGRCFVMGGAQVYAQALEYADTLFLTHIHAILPEADVFFPSLDPAVWKRDSVSETFSDPETGYLFEFAVYSRI